MPGSTCPNRSVSRPLPTDYDLDKLSSLIRTAARERGFPSHVIDRYEAWIFQFLAWCLKAPPYQVDIERIGGFWKALSQRGDKGRVCEAMDALSFFFGALDGLKGLYDRTSASPARGERGRVPKADMNNSANDGRDSASRSSPTSRLARSDDWSDPWVNGSASNTESSVKERSQYLPDGPLPDGMDPRSVIPTQVPERERPTSEQSVTEETSKQSPRGTSEAGCRREERDSKVTLFNPTGAASTTDGTEDLEENPKENAPRNNGPGHSASSNGANQANSDPDDDTERARKGEEKTSTGPTKRWDTRREEQGPVRASDRKVEKGSGEERVSFSVGRHVAKRLRDAAHRLGLPPGVFAARALDLVCEEVGIDGPSDKDAESPLEQYQAQLDLLHLEAKEQA